MKRTLTLLLSLAMVFALALTGCGGGGASSGTTGEESNTSGETSMTDGIYEETTIGMKTFFRFNEDGTYYVYLFDGGYMEAGTYEVTDEGTEYRVEGDDSETAETKTSAQTIVLTSYTGSVTTYAFDDDTMQDVDMFGFGGYRFFHHNAEYEYVAADEELSIAIYTFYANNETGSSLTLYHDKTFVDYTGDVGVEGTWEKTGDGAFTLTTEDGETITLTIDGSSATYGDVTLSDTVVAEGEATVINTYRVDEAEVGLPMTVGLRIDCYSDSTCTLVVEIAQTGSELVADTGTYELDDLVYCPTFHFAIAGDIASEPDYANATATGLPASVHYAAEVEATDDTGTATPLTIDATLTGTASSAAVPTSTPETTEKTVFNSVSVADATVDGLPMPVGLRIDMYDDGTCEFIMETEVYVGYDLVMDTGTYELAEMTYHPTFHFEKAGDIESEPDYANATADGLPFSVTYATSMEVDPGDGSVATYTFNSVLTGMVVVPEE